MERFKLNFYVSSTLNVTRDITRSIRDLETDIVDLECASESTGNRGYIEILKTKKMALANLLDTKVGCACPVQDPKHHRDGCSIEFLLWT